MSCFSIIQQAGRDHLFVQRDILTILRMQRSSRVLDSIKPDDILFLHIFFLIGNRIL